MNMRFLFSTTVLGMLVMAGCSSGRDVEVSGEITAPASVQGDILISFYELTGEGEKAERSLIHDATLAGLGPFTETVPIEGDALVVVAIADADGDGKCTEGELWGEAEAQIENDKVEGLAVALSAAACPGSE